jgi:hypothetical protein
MQTKLLFVREVLKTFKMDQCKSSIVPMQQNVKLSCDDGSKEVNGTMYRQMVGSLCYHSKKPFVVADQRCLVT